MLLELGLTYGTVKPFALEQCKSTRSPSNWFSLSFLLVIGLCIAQFL